MDAELGHGGDGKGTDVQRRALGMGNPVLLDLHQCADGLHKVLLGNARHAQALLRVVHAAGVAVRAKELNFTLGGAIGLQALKALLRIVEHHGGGLQGEGGIGHNAGIVPALALGVVHNKHVVGKGLSEAQLRLVRRLCLGGSRLRDLDVQHLKFSLTFILNR
ncbi:hypothetical protein SDC9_121506 [bioreactor metagenome]|uniref:Uncharacterized protein n=1 Tax=bioreactor metagenome TaxID=1076179 RepID=A0A645CCA1_9ZZZZ